MPSRELETGGGVEGGGGRHHPAGVVLQPRQVGLRRGGRGPRLERGRVGLSCRGPACADTTLRFEDAPGGADYPAVFRGLQGAFDAVRPFFAHDPADPGAYVRRAAELEALWAGPRGDERRRRLADAVAPYLQRIGATPEQEANLTRLAEPGALAVVAGQQPGLLGGPLFTALKAVTVLRLGADLEARLGRPVVPVFWVAGEDHDYPEVDHVRVLNSGGGSAVLRLPPLTPPRGSVGEVEVPPPDAEAAIGDVLAGAGDGAAAERAAELLRSTRSRHGRTTLADWFARQLVALFGSRGLVVVDSMLPGVRALEAEVMGLAWDMAPRIGESLAAGAAALAAAGQAAPLALEPDHLHLFGYVGGRRVALFRQGEAVAARNGALSMPGAELRAAVEAQPDRFSPNVVLRFVCEEHLFPLLAHVAGPGEAAYLAQMKDVCGLLGRAMPVVAPRLALTLVLPEDREALARGGMSLEDLGDRFEAALAHAVAARSPVDVPGLFAAEREAVQARYHQLMRALDQVSPDLRPIGEANLERVLFQLRYFEGKAQQHERRSQRELVSAVSGARERLRPAGHLQEQEYSVWSYLLRCGTGLVDRLTEAAPLMAGHQWVHVDP